MNTLLRALPLGLSCLLLAAHLLRSGHLLFALAALAAPLLLAFRTPAVVRGLQALLILAALEWVRTAVTLALDRFAAGEPAGRMLLILGTVALVTLLSALPLQKLAKPAPP